MHGSISWFRMPGNKTINQAPRLAFYVHDVDAKEFTRYMPTY